MCLHFAEDKVFAILYFERVANFDAILVRFVCRDLYDLWLIVLLSCDLDLAFCSEHLLLNAIPERALADRDFSYVCLLSHICGV